MVYTPNVETLGTLHRWSNFIPAPNYHDDWKSLETIEAPPPRVHALTSAWSNYLFQQELKWSWKTLSQRPLLGQDYGTNIQNWTCRCGTQQFQPQHLCKHLVQLVTVNLDFFAQLNRQQTMPIYENPALGNSVSDAKGSISAGNDFLWMGRCGNLSNGKWWLIVDPGTSSGIRHSCSPSLGYGPQNKKASF